jgi:hypothetical protein
MKLAVMQPYFFPYIGYWQLIQAADRFVIYDDVNYIPRGWVNRNRLLINGRPSYITVPLQKSSRNKRICDTFLQPSPRWRNKMIGSIEHTYRNAPYFAEVNPVVEKAIRHDTDDLSAYLANQLQTLANFLGMSTEFVATSRVYQNNDLSGQERVLDICNREHVSAYINPRGGRALYERDEFKHHGVDLYFIETQPFTYSQRASGFVPDLSIIDVLMNCGREGTGDLLGKHELA